MVKFLSTIRYQEQTGYRLALTAVTVGKQHQSSTWCYISHEQLTTTLPPCLHGPLALSIVMI